MEKTQFELVKITSFVFKLERKNQFIKLDISNWRMSKVPKIPVQIDRRLDFSRPWFSEIRVQIKRLPNCSAMKWICNIQPAENDLQNGLTIFMRGFTVAFWCRPTLFKSENGWQKIEKVPIPLPRASRNFPDVKTRNEKKIYNSTLEIIPFIRFGKQMDRT